MSKLRKDVNLTTDGVVVFPGGCMHPYSFRDMFPEWWDELLARPRIPSLYPELENEPDETPEHSADQVDRLIQESVDILKEPKS